MTSSPMNATFRGLSFFAADSVATQSVSRGSADLPEHIRLEEEEREDDLSGSTVSEWRRSSSLKSSSARTSGAHLKVNAAYTRTAHDLVSS